jgi:ABC-type dipeptide/oligopeptide/nickel transport system permease component
VSAVKRGTAWDYGANVVALWGLSTPNFWLGIMLILLFSVTLGWLPASGYVSPFEDWRANLASMIMPAFVLGNAIAAVLMRHTRSAMLQVLSSDYVRTARAKGVLERDVVLKHALRNALIPIITLGALEFGTLLSGAVLTEQVFTIPGFGKLITTPSQSRLCRRAGCRAVHGDRLHRAEPARRHRVRRRQSTDPRPMTVPAAAIAGRTLPEQARSDRARAASAVMRRLLRRRPRQWASSSSPASSSSRSGERRRAVRSDCDELFVRKAPSIAHWFGTDEIGRDAVTRLCRARASLLAGVVSVLISISVGVPVGLLAGYAGGMTDMLISRVTDALLACPFLILAIALAAFLGRA